MVTKHENSPVILVLWEYGCKGPLHPVDEQKDSPWQSKISCIERGQHLDSGQ